MNFVFDLDSINCANLVLFQVEKAAGDDMTVEIVDDRMDHWHVRPSGCIRFHFLNHLALSSSKRNIEAGQPGCVRRFMWKRAVKSARPTWLFQGAPRERGGEFANHSCYRLSGDTRPQAPWVAA